jgi:hypothetical protein
MTSTMAQAERMPFFELMQLQLGHYQCSHKLCEINDKREMWLEKMHDYSGFMLYGVSGWVEAIRATEGAVHEVEVKWDDGSGKPNAETIRIQSLGERSFLFIDSQGRSNRMELSEQ